MAHTSPSIEQNLSVLRNHTRGWAKVAELGGDGQDIPFEQALSNLAHAYLRDKAPSLLEYEVGFQLLERNQENTKAVGVVAFKVGSQWLYIPIFFLRGELRGHELLYLKDQDMFVPLKENWLNYLLNRKPNILGDGTNKNTSNLGVMHPDLRQLSQPPTKQASAQSQYPDWVQGFLPVMAYMATTHPSKQAKFDDIISFPEILEKEAGAVKFLREVGQQYPAILKAAADIYGDELSSAVTKAKQFKKEASSILTSPASVARVAKKVPMHPIKSGSLEIITKDTEGSTMLPVQDEEEQEKLLRDGILIRDTRDGDEVSVAYNTQVESKIFNPTETGLYEVLTNAGELEECLVTIAPVAPKGRESISTIARKSSNGYSDWVNANPKDIFVTRKIDDEDYQSWFDGLSSADSLSNNGTYILIGPTGEATLPFSPTGQVGDADGGKTYKAHFTTHISKGQSLKDRYRQLDVYREKSDVTAVGVSGDHVHLKGKAGSKLVASDGNVFVPEGFKSVRLSGDSDSSDSDKKRLPLVPGSVIDAELNLMAKTSELTIYNNRSEVEINGLRMRPTHAFITLIKDHGFREKQARAMLLEAERKQKVRYRVKYAEYAKQAQDPFLQPGPSAPGFPAPDTGTMDIMGGQIPAQYPTSSEVPVDTFKGTPEDYDPTMVPDPMAMQVAQQAAGTGQKEIFDTAILGSMLKSVRQDSMTDRYMGDLMKGMDRVGRILFLFYFHQDKFADRYGKADLPELEDSLRNTFEAIGDLVLFLKQKSVDPYPEEGDLGVDLSSIAGE